MGAYTDKVAECAAFIRPNLAGGLKLGLLTGTGLSQSTASIETRHQFDYRDLPYFPVSTVESHRGNLILGELAGTQMIALQGRVHLYEGYSPREVTFPVRVMQELGVENLIVSNASGGLNEAFTAGDIMLIDDQINLTAQNPLAGAHDPRWGLRFPDMSRAYDSRLAALAQNVGDELGLKLQTGVYAGLKGPSLETPAEARFLSTIGADAVGFSTVLEVIVAVQAGMRVLGLSTITNVHHPDDPVPATVEDIIEVAEAASDPLQKIIAGVAARI